MASATLNSTNFSPIAILLLGLLLQNLFFVGLAQFALRQQALSLRSVGLTRLTAQHLLLGIALGLGMAFGIFWIGATEERLFQWLLPPTTFQSLLVSTNNTSAEQAFKQLHYAFPMLLFALLGSVVAPIGEEVLFRGMLYTTLKRRVRAGSLIPLIVSALLFALIHASPLHLIPLFLMGLGFTIAYERTGSLWVPILMHAVNNGVTFLMLALAS